MHSTHAKHIHMGNGQKHMQKFLKIVSKNKITYKHVALEHNQPTPTIEFVRVTHSIVK
jgi:hypothetical protein